MSEELLQRDLIKNPEKIGKWDFYNIGATSIKALREYGIIPDKNYGKEDKKKVDALITTNTKVVAVIEYKKPSSFKTAAQKKKAIDQEIEVARKLNAKLMIATDTKDTIWINVETGNKILDEKNKKLLINFDPKDEKLPILIEKILYSINSNNDQIKPKKLVNPTDLARQIWQDIWAVSGATPENCLYTFVELFIYKYLSDLDVLKGIYSFNTLISNFETNNAEEILENYASVVRPKIKELFPESSIDKTTIINGTIFVSKDHKAVKGYSTVFKKILLKFHNYGKLENIDYDFKSQLFESFLKESISKKNWGQFFTPLKVVRAIAHMAKDEIKSGITICDPACGVGKFLLDPIASKLSTLYKINSKGIFPKITIEGFDKGFDKDEQKTIILAKANMLIYFSDLIRDNPGLTKEFSELFNQSFTLKSNSILGTLSEPIENRYDLILTNPPYVSSGSSNLKEEIKKDGTLINHYKINALGVEGLFMEWIIRALKPGGKSFIVVPDGLFDRRDDKNLRQFIIDTCFIDGIISLPKNTFFTTTKKTNILCITKKNSDSDIQTDPVFSYLVSEIGESRDVYRFDIDRDDLSEAVTLFNFFKGNKKAFQKINKDKRCKSIEFDHFLNNVENNWIIEKKWTRDELISLEILGADTKVKVNEFPLLLDEITNTIDQLKNELTILLNENNSEQSHSKNYLNFPLSELFIFPSIKGLTKKFIQSVPGAIPVYGGKQYEIPIGHIQDNLDGVKYFENCLGWNREGSVGYVFYHQHKFTTNDHHRPLILKPEYENLIDLEYVKVVLQALLMEQGFKWSKTASKEKVSKLSIKLPVNKDNTLNYQIQKTISKRIQKIEEIKTEITHEISKITQASIDVE